MSEPGRSSAFTWNAGGWFGAQLGSTLWMLILGGLLLARDPATGLLCLAGGLGLNGLGLGLWLARRRLRPYLGIQAFLLGTSLVVAVLVLVVNARGLSRPPEAGALVATYLPWWVITLPPGLMAGMAWLRHQRR